MRRNDKRARTARAAAPQHEQIPHRIRDAFHRIGLDLAQDIIAHGVLPAGHARQRAQRLKIFKHGATPPRSAV